MVRFTFEDKFWNLRNPANGDKIDFEFPTVHGRSASGVLYRYERGISFSKLELEFENLDSEEKTKFIDMFNIIRSRFFVYENYDGKLYNAVFLTSVLNFENEYDYKKKQSWKLSVEMEIIAIS